MRIVLILFDVIIAIVMIAIFYIEGLYIPRSYSLPSGDGGMIGLYWVFVFICMIILHATIQIILTLLHSFIKKILFVKECLFICSSIVSIIIFYFSWNPLSKDVHSLSLNSDILLSAIIVVFVHTTLAILYYKCCKTIFQYFGGNVPYVT
ncbi:hypothetical protein [Dysgonomonas sp. 520]|uniref:hypothetical protein n=1 Tax=Dysgonomonas sp. 520 TaxID=2302931 RepID=UPI0013D1D517|nr:hypothetical protein [Dysgonomonas sp. 520]NDW11013.1 hypothetical protein [Dysgonomonas sp. 520]